MLLLQRQNRRFAIVAGSGTFGRSAQKLLDQNPAARLSIYLYCCASATHRRVRY